MMHQKLKQILDDAAAEGLMPANPALNKTIKAPRPECERRNSLSLNQAIKLRTECHTVQEYSRHMAIFIGLGTGFRRGEVLGLQWKHIVFSDAPTAKIEQQLVTKKNGYEPPKAASYRTIALDAETMKRLKEWKIAQRSYLEQLDKKQTDETPIIADRNGEAHDPDNYGDWFRDFCVKHGYGRYVDGSGNEIPFPKYNDKGFPVDEHGKPYSRSNRKPKIKKHYMGLKFHELRHTRITLQIGNGMDIVTVSRRAGHKKVSTTTDIYAHAIPENDRAVADLIGDLLAG